MLNLADCYPNNVRFEPVEYHSKEALKAQKHTVSVRISPIRHVYGVRLCVHGVSKLLHVCGTNVV